MSSGKHQGNQVDLSQQRSISNRKSGQQKLERKRMVNHSEISEWLEEKSPSVIVATDGFIRYDVTAWGGAM